MSEKKSKSSSSSLDSSSSEDRSRGVPLRKPVPKKSPQKQSRSSSNSRSDSFSSDEEGDRNRRKELVDEKPQESKKRQKSSQSSHSDDGEHEFKVRKIQSQPQPTDAHDASDRPTQFNAKNWTRERKPEQAQAPSKQKKAGSLKLKGMVSKGHGKQTHFEKAAEAKSKVGTYEDQLDSRCKKRGDKFCA